MSDLQNREIDDAEIQSPDYTEGPVLPGDVASAGRSCSIILILLLVLVLLLCVATGIRWYTKS